MAQTAAWTRHPARSAPNEHPPSCATCRRSFELAHTGVDTPAQPALLPPVAPRRFEIVRCLGHGGMGIVYEATDRERGGRVAIKRLRDALPESVFRLQREFEFLAGTRHPGWVRAFELIEEAGTWFMTMELLDAVDFQTWVRPEGALDEHRLRDALRQLVAAVSSVHAAGKAHRDIKPSNVMVTREGRVVLLDFGLIGDLDGHGGVEGDSVGTPAYVAPEQAAGHVPEPAADWYAVGAMLYHALTGALPFSGNAAEYLWRKANEDAAPPSACEAGVPADLDRLCLELLARDPAARPGGDELASRLAGQPPRELAVRATALRSAARGASLAAPREAGVSEPLPRAERRQHRADITRHVC